MKWGRDMLYEYPAIFTRLRKGYQISFPDFGRSIRADSLPVAMTKASVFLCTYYWGYGDKALPVPTAVSSILMRKNSSF